MCAQIAITRNGITQASSDKSPPEGGVLARRTNGDFLISLHRHVSKTALVQMMRSLRALDPGFEMSLEMAGNHPSPVTPGYLPAILRLLGHIYIDDPVMQRSRH